MNRSTIVLIGGAPGVGKTTLGRALAARRGVASISVDDLRMAAQAVTTPESHPGLHVMRRGPSLQYFTNAPPERLRADALEQHDAVWPIVEYLVRKRARFGTGLVLDGWYMHPERVAALDLAPVHAVWLWAAPAVLEARERANAGFTEGSTDPERMLAHFLDRSLWFNAWVRAEAERLGLPVLEQTGERTVDALCDELQAGC